MAGVPPKDPRLRKTSAPQPTITIPPPQPAPAVASPKDVPSPSSVPSPTSSYSPGSPTLPPSLLPTSSAPPPPPPTQYPSRQNSLNFHDGNNFRPNEDRRARDDRPRDEFRPRTDDRPRDDPRVKDDPTPRLRDPYRPRDDHRGGRQDSFHNYDPPGSASRHAGPSTSDRNGHVYGRDPPPDPRTDKDRHYRNNYSNNADKFSRPSSPVRRGRSPVSHDHQRRGRSPLSARSRATSAAPTTRQDLPPRGRSPPRATDKRLTASHNGVLEPPASETGSTSKDSAQSSVTRYRNPFSRTTDDIKQKHDTYMQAGPSKPPPPPIPPIPPSIPLSSASSSSSSRLISSDADRGSTSSALYDSYARRSQSVHRSSSRPRSRSRERGERGRSKARGESKERGRGRSKSRAGSKDRSRARSKSRALSKTRLRSVSRPRRTAVTMGEFTRKRPRSPSMSRYGDDDSSNFSDSLTASSASDDDRYRSRSGKGSRRRKKRRYSDVLSSDSSSSSEGSSDDGSDSDLLLSRRKLPTSRASVVSDPMSRFNGPLTEMMAQMSTVMDKCTTRADKLMAKVKKLESLKKKIDVEMRELGKELRMQRNSGSPQIGQSEVVAAGGPGYFQNLSRDPLPIPPSLKPVSINANGSSSSNGGSSSSSSHLLPDDSHAFPHPRASGFRRVFEKSTYSLPIGTQPTLAVLSVGPMNVFEKAFGKKPRPMEINPFSHQTQFDGIAASSSLDGHIQFWDINAQKLMLSVPPRENRVIPYAETLTWVSEDAIVAVSHLKTGSRWPEPSAEPSNAELTTHSAPEAQTNLITIYFNREGQLGFRVLTITTMPHLKPINTVTAVMGEDHSVSYVTGGSDKRLFHWKFGPPDNQSLTGYEPQGLVELHQAHSNSITSTMYSHTSKTLYSGGLDGKYVSFSLEHQKVIREQRLGQVLHIVQNPMDPRINLVAVLSRSRQYLLVDERTPTQTVLNVGYWTQSKISKLSVPSWQPGGGLLCTGASTDGAIYLWDVRWNSIKTEINRRPGKGVVIGDVKYNGAVKSQNHPIFRNQLLQPEVPLRDTPGGPSQILEIPGKKVVQACFHPTKNVMMIINSDCNLTFMNYSMRNDPIN